MLNILSHFKNREVEESTAEREKAYAKAAESNTLQLSSEFMSLSQLLSHI